MNLDPVVFFSFITISVAIILIISFRYIRLLKIRRENWKIKVLKALKKLDKKNLNLENQIVELDKILEYTLQNKFSIKQSLGNILKNYPHNFPPESLNEIWKSHKLRNKIVHDIDFSVKNHDLNSAKKTLIRQIKKEL